MATLNRFMGSRIVTTRINPNYNLLGPLKIMECGRRREFQGVGRRPTPPCLRSNISYAVMEPETPLGMPKLLVSFSIGS